MQATEQAQLLRSLRVSSALWTGIPSIFSMCCGGPLLALINYFTLVSAGVEGLALSVPGEEARAKFKGAIRDDAFQAFWEHNFNGCQFVECGFSGYPPFILFYRSLGFMLAIFCSIQVSLHVLLPSTSPSHIAPRLSFASSAAVLSIFVLEFAYGLALYSSVDMDLTKILRR